MSDLELLVSAFTLFQGVFFFMLTLLSLVSRLAVAGLSQQGWDLRHHTKSVSFFECAVFSRLISQVRYTLPALGVLVAYVIYDMDLVFFLSEAVSVGSWAPQQLIVFVVYSFLFVVALVVDNRLGGFYWDN